MKSWLLKGQELSKSLLVGNTNSIIPHHQGPVLDQITNRFQKSCQFGTEEFVVEILVRDHLIGPLRRHARCWHR